MFEYDFSWRKGADVDDYATLFASSGVAGKDGSMLYYRPHEIEGIARADWRIEMPLGESITCTPSVSEKNLT